MQLWTLHLLADKVVELLLCREHLLETVGPTQKNELKPWKKKEWCIPKVSGEFVARMEELDSVPRRVLTRSVRWCVLTRPPSSYRGREAARQSQARTGGFRRYDTEYQRNGTRIPVHVL